MWHFLSGASGGGRGLAYTLEVEYIEQAFIGCSVSAADAGGRSFSKLTVSDGRRGRVWLYHMKGGSNCGGCCILRSGILCFFPPSQLSSAGGPVAHAQESELSVDGFLLDMHYGSLWVSRQGARMWADMASSVTSWQTHFRTLALALLADIRTVGKLAVIVILLIKILFVSVLPSLLKYLLNKLWDKLVLEQNVVAAVAWSCTCIALGVLLSSKPGRSCHLLLPPEPFDSVTLLSLFFVFFLQLWLYFFSM